MIVVSFILALFFVKTWSTEGSQPFEISVNGENFVFYDNLKTLSIFNLQREMGRDNYNISGINFSYGDVVLDIGGNIGCFSIPLARKYPFLKIFSFEPMKRSFDNFRRNILLNNVSVGTITLIQKAITGDGRNVTMFHGRQSIMDGMAETDSWFFLGNQKNSENVESVTLTQVFEEYHIEKCKLLKMDCEGCEYESLYSTGEDILRRINSFRGEFHRRPGLEKKNFIPAKLENDFKDMFSDFRVSLVNVDDHKYEPKHKRREKVKRRRK